MGSDSRPVIALSGDNHLDIEEGNWSRRPIRGDAAYSLQQIVDYAIENNLAWLISLGDSAEKTRPDSASVKFWAEQIERCHDQEVQFGYIQGQHEYVRKPFPPWLSMNPHAQHLDRACLNFGKKLGHWYFLDFRPAVELQQALAEIPKEARTLCAHQVWEDLMGGLKGEACFGDVPVVKRLFTGDLHEQVHHETRGKDNQKLEVWTTGSTNMREITETPHKYFLTVDEKGTVDRVPLKTRQVIRQCEILTADDLDMAINGWLPAAIQTAYDRAKIGDYPEELQMPLWRVVYATDVEGAYERLVKATAGKVHVFFKEERPAAQVAAYRARSEERQKIRQQGLLGCLEKHVPDTKSTRYSDLRRLLTTEDQAQELDALVAERLADEAAV